MFRKLVLFALLGALCAGSMVACRQEAPPDTRPVPVATATPSTGSLLGADAALAAAMRFVNDRYAAVAPPMELQWQRSDTTPPGLLGSASYRYTAETCIATVSHPVVNPELTVYAVRIIDTASGFDWAGSVQATGTVQEVSGPGLAAEAAPDDVLAARDAALAFVRQRYGSEAPGPDLVWQAAFISDAAPFGGSGYRFSSPPWSLLIRFPIVRPAFTIFSVELHNPTTGFSWQGEVDADGAVRETVIATADYNYDGWGTYTHPLLGYSLRLPPSTTISSASVEQTVTIAGSLLAAEQIHWPVFTVSHFDSPFYHPPAGADVDSWVAGLGFTYDELGSPTTIDGHPAVHLVVGARPQADPYDLYYVIDGEQLYTILILHAGGHRDDALADQFLAGIRFPSSVAAAPTATPATPDRYRGIVGRYPPGFQYTHFLDVAGERYVLSPATEAVAIAIDQAAWLGALADVTARAMPLPRLLAVSEVTLVEVVENSIRNLSMFATPMASSVLPADRLGTYHAWSAIDGDLTTCWSEGVPGHGVEEWIQLDFDRPVVVTMLQIDVGYDYSPAILTMNNRLRQARLLFSDGTELVWLFEDQGGLQMIPLARAPGPNIEVTWVRIVIESVFEGTTYDDTCIAEIEVWGMAR